jgi:hypothetical protein
MKLSIGDIGREVQQVKCLSPFSRTVVLLGQKVLYCSDGQEETIQIGLWDVV